MSHTISRALLLLGALAALAAIAAAGAPAREFRISAANLTERGQETITTMGGQRVICNVTRRGEIPAANIRKVVGTVIGRYREVITERCMGGNATAMGLPWNKTYLGFTGTLPRMASFRWDIRGRWEVTIAELFEIRCNYGETQSVSLLLPEGRTVRLDESVSIRSETGGLCPEITMSGTLTLTSAIRVELI